MAPTSNNIGYTDASTRLNLGCHQSFIESSRALIRNTNSRIEKMQNMSEEIKYLASQITDDQGSVEKVKLIPEVKQIRNNKKSDTKIQERPTIKVVIPIGNEKQQQQISKRVTDIKMSKKGKTKIGGTVYRKNNSMRKWKESPETLKEENVKTNTEMCNAEQKGSLENVDKSVVLNRETTMTIQTNKVTEKFDKSRQSYDDKKQHFVGKNLGSRKRDSHKILEFTNHRHADEIEVLKPSLDQSKVPETVRFVRSSSFTPTKLKTNVINLSLQPRAKSQYFQKNRVTKSHTGDLYSDRNMVSQLHNHHSVYTKKGNSFEEMTQHGRNETDHLLKKEEILRKSMPKLFLKEQIPLMCDTNTDFRFRFLHKANKRFPKIGDLSSSKVKYSTTLSSQNVKLSVF